MSLAVVAVQLMAALLPEIATLTLAGGGGPKPTSKVIVAPDGLMLLIFTQPLPVGGFVFGVVTGLMIAVPLMPGKGSPGLPSSHAPPVSHPDSQKRSALSPSASRKETPGRAGLALTVLVAMLLVITAWSMNQTSKPLPGSP